MQAPVLPPSTPPPPTEPPRGLLARITPLEWGAAAVLVVAAVVLVVVEPDVLQAPFQSGRSLAFSVGGTVLAAIALLVMLHFRVPAVLRLLVLGIPLLAVSWWLVSPYFVDRTVDDEFAVSIDDALAAPGDAGAPAAEGDTAAPPADGAETAADAPAAEGDAAPPPAADAPADASPPAPAGPVLLGAGQLVGLAGHHGTGDAALFTLEDGSTVLRMEDVDIQNGPDLRVYVVPGADQIAPTPDSAYLGALRGNVGDQTYELPADFTVTPGDWTVLVWCEAFSVEFVAATLTVA